MTEPDPKPLLLVDIDGVINVVGGVHGKRGFEANFKLRGYRIRVPAGTKQRFADLAAAFDCVWATTWEDDAPILGRHAGFGMDWPWIDFGLGGTQVGTWKLPDVERWCLAQANGRPVAWIDDDLEDDVDQWAKRRDSTLIVRTRMKEGLTDAQTEELLRWAANRA